MEVFGLYVSLQSKKINMKKFFLLVFLAANQLMAQLPNGLSPSSVTPEDLEAYGVTQEDVNDFVKKYGEGGTSTTNTSKAEVGAEPVKVVKEKTIVVEKKAEPAIAESKVYGKSLFNNKNLAVYESATHIKASPNYILGAGDEVSISIWGYSEHNAVYTIDQNGSITPKMVGKIYLKGKKYAQAEKLIKSRFARVYDLKNSEFTMSLNYSKVIRVNIVGEVNKPGTYSVPAINSAFNILALAGGISDNGSVRDIEIKRAGKVVTRLDVYQFLNDPDYKADFYLADNDYVIVNTARKVVKINGEVAREGSYELKKDEGIKDLIDYAGGFRASAYTKRLLVYRYEDNSDETMEVNFDSLNVKKDFDMKNGDRVSVQPIPKEIRNRVELKGAVNIPGFYMLKDSTTVGDLINMGEGLRVDAFMEKAFIRRRNDDFTYTRIEVNIEDEVKGKRNTLLQEFDELSVYSKEDFMNETSVKIIGAVKKEGDISFSEGLTLGDALFLSGGLLPEAAVKKIEISRIADFDNTSLTPVRMTVQEVEVEDNLLSERNKLIRLQPNDIILVRTVSNYKKQEMVVIAGEVLFPGQYAMESADETVMDLIKRAGGLTDWAFLEGATFSRADGENSGKYIVFNLKELVEEKGEEYNYILRRGDKIVIPKKENFVTLSGAVKYPKVKKKGSIILPFEGGKSAKFYVNKYGGGFAKNAKRSNTYVETPGGHVKRTKRFLFWKIYPKVELGDQITVLNKKKKDADKKPKSEPVDWNKAIERTTVKLTGLATLYVILSTAFSQ